MYLQVVFLKVGQIDTIGEKYEAEVFIQARWREPELDWYLGKVSGCVGGNSSKILQDDTHTHTVY